MKKNVVFRSAFKRDNLVKSFVFDAMMKISSYPKLILEVFIRRNFGRRYYATSSVLTVTVLLIAFPLFANRLTISYDSYGDSTGFWARYATWYLYTAAFAYFSFRRWLEIDHSRTTVDFTKFSLYSGDLHPSFFQFNILGEPDAFLVETVLEPVLFFIPGFVLACIGQPVGYLLLTSAIIYSYSYRAAYRKGTDMILDMIDEMLMNAMYQSAFVDDLLGQYTKGVRYYMQKPHSREARENLKDAIIVDSESDERFTIAE